MGFHNVSYLDLFLPKSIDSMLDLLSKVLNIRVSVYQ